MKKTCYLPFVFIVLPFVMVAQSPSFQSSADSNYLTLIDIINNQEDQSVLLMRPPSPNPPFNFAIISMLVQNGVNEGYSLIYPVLGQYGSVIGEKYHDNKFYFDFRTNFGLSLIHI